MPDNYGIRRYNRQCDSIANSLLREMLIEVMVGLFSHPYILSAIYTALRKFSDKSVPLVCLANLTIY